MSTQVITLIVPAGFQKPTILAEATPDEIATILNIGCIGFTEAKNKSSAINLGDVIAKSLADGQAKLQQELEQARKDLLASKDAMAEQARLSTLAIRNAEKEKDDYYRAQLADQQKRMEILQGRAACSSLKGQTNETEMDDLLTNVFGSAPDYEVLPKQLNGGDHLIRWCGYKLMVEDKFYTDQVPEKEVNKAHIDFTRHRDCDALIFISAKSQIRGHQKPGNLDIGLVDGRPVLYIGCMDLNEDKVVYLQTLQPVIHELIKLTKKANTDHHDTNEHMAEKIRIIRKQLLYHQKDVQAVHLSALAYARTQKATWTEHLTTIQRMRNNFELTLKDILSDGTDEVEETATATTADSVSESDADSEPKEEVKTEEKSCYCKKQVKHRGRCPKAPKAE